MITRCLLKTRKFFNQDPRDDKFLKGLLCGNQVVVGGWCANDLQPKCVLKEFGHAKVIKS